jgi:hypothetical protein
MNHLSSQRLRASNRSVIKVRWLMSVFVGLTKAGARRFRAHYGLLVSSQNHSSSSPQWAPRWERRWARPSGRPSGTRSGSATRGASGYGQINTSYLGRAMMESQAAIQERFVWIATQARSA